MLGTVLPGIFLAVAVFILNVVMSRQVATQRQQVAALKALGYTDRSIALHYIELALLVAAAGTAAGLALSIWFGESLLALYAQVFRFTALEYRTVPSVAGIAVLAVAAAAALGAYAAIRAVVRLSPAQAMQPPAPPLYRATFLERLGLARRAGPGARMVIRNIERRPLRAALTVAGIAAAVALQISGAFWADAIAHIVDVQFHQVQRGDVLLGFTSPVGLSATQSLLRLPGVLDAELTRSEPVRVSAHGRREDTALTGHAPGRRCCGWSTPSAARWRCPSRA